MAVQKYRDNPNEIGFKGFRKAFSKNARGKTLAYTIPTSLALGFGYLVYSPIAHQQQFDALSKPTIDAIESITQENGIIASGDHIAIRYGDEFMVYERNREIERSGQLMYRYMQQTDALRISESYANNTNKTYLLMGAIGVPTLPSYSWNIQNMSAPFSIDDDPAINIRVDTFSMLEELTDPEQKTSEITSSPQADWAQVYDSIADGGYDNVPQQITINHDDLPLSIDDDRIKTNASLLTILAFSIGQTMLASGLAANDMRRRKKKIKNSFK
jgi:hypothetical protein